MVYRLPLAENLTEQGAAPDVLRVGTLAERTHKTVRALHLYEELGLLEPSERTKGGFRLYSPDAELRVRWISKLQDLGFTLPEIQETLHQWNVSGSATGAMAKIQKLYRQKLQETEDQIASLKVLSAELSASVAYLETCDVCDPERLISSCPRCDLHVCGAPELVAGLHAHKHPKHP